MPYRYVRRVPDAESSSTFVVSSEELEVVNVPDLTPEDLMNGNSDKFVSGTDAEKMLFGGFESSDRPRPSVSFFAKRKTAIREKVKSVLSRVKSVVCKIRFDRYGCLGCFGNQADSAYSCFPNESKSPKTSTSGL